MKKWIKLKNRISDNPSLIDPYRIMNYRAAKKAWRVHGRLSTWEFMEGARIKAAKTPSEWEALTGIKRKHKGEISSATRRWAIALMIIILISSFLTFTVPGRALAKKLYEVVTTFVGNMLYVGTASEINSINQVPERGTADDPTRVSSLQDACAQIKEPILCLNSEKYEINSITLSNARAAGRLMVTEYTLDDVKIALIQKWPPEGTPLELNLLLENGEYHEYVNQINLHFYGSYTEKDRTYFCGTINAPSTGYVCINDVSDFESVESILSDITFYSP